MERIASFCVDHTTLQPGMYLSRQDGPNGEILTWDIRMKRPNQGDYARNSRWSRSVVYVGPMGCLTGFYLVTMGMKPEEALSLTIDSFDFMAVFDGPIPGASAVECGNYLMMDPIAARREACAMAQVLHGLTERDLYYKP